MLRLLEKRLFLHGVHVVVCAAGERRIKPTDARVIAPGAGDLLLPLPEGRRFRMPGAHGLRRFRRFFLREPFHKGEFLRGKCARAFLRDHGRAAPGFDEVRLLQGNAAQAECFLHRFKQRFAGKLLIQHGSFHRQIIKPGRLRAPHRIIRRGGSGKVQRQLKLQAVIQIRKIKAGCARFIVDHAEETLAFPIREAVQPVDLAGEQAARAV